MKIFKKIILYSLSICFMLLITHKKIVAVPFIYVYSLLILLFFLWIIKPLVVKRKEIQDNLRYANYFNGYNIFLLLLYTYLNVGILFQITISSNSSVVILFFTVLKIAFSILIEIIFFLRIFCKDVDFPLD